MFGAWWRQDRFLSARLQYIRSERTGNIDHLYPNSSGGLSNLPLQLGHNMVIMYQRKQCDYFSMPFSQLISVSKRSHKIIDRSLVVKLLTVHVRLLTSRCSTFFFGSISAFVVTSLNKISKSTNTAYIEDTLALAQCFLYVADKVTSYLTLLVSCSRRISTGASIN